MNDLTSEKLSKEKSKDKVIESVVRTFSLVPAEFIEDSIKIEVLLQVNHDNHQIKAAVFDFARNFGKFLLQEENIEYLTNILQHLAHPDSMIRSSVENLLLTIQKHSKTGEFVIKIHDNIKSLVKTFLQASEYFKKVAGIKLFAFYGTELILLYKNEMIELLLDKDNTVRIELFECLRFLISNSNSLELYPLVRDHLKKILEQYNKSKNEKDGIQKTILKLLSCHHDLATDNIQFAKKCLTSVLGDIGSKRQSLLLLASANSLQPDLADIIVNLLRTTNQSELLEVLESLSKIGAPLANIVPNMIVLLKHEGSFIKRKLISFITPYQNQLSPQILSFQHVIAMSSDSDPVVKCKAAELIPTIIKFLPESLPNTRKTALTLNAIDVLVGMNKDPNPKIRREAILSLGNVGNYRPQLITEITNKILHAEDDPLSHVVIWRLLSFTWNSLIACSPKD